MIWLLYRVIFGVLHLLRLAVVVHAIMSWINVSSESGLGRFREFLSRIVEPMETPLRRVGCVWNGIDFSPIAVLVILVIIERVLLFLLF